MTNDRKPWDHAHETRPCTLTDIAELEGDAPEGFIDDCNEYLSIFAAPIMVPQFSTIPDSDKVMGCLHCGEPLTGGIASWLAGKGGFQWGLAHGEGRCSGCGWPARAYHFAKDKDGKELFTLRPFVLQYLPDADAAAKARAEITREAARRI